MAQSLGGRMKNKNKGMEGNEYILIIGTVSWIIAWIILFIKVDFWTYVGLIFYALGISWITIKIWSLERRRK